MPKQKLAFLQTPGAVLSDRDLRLAVESSYLKIKPFSKIIQPSSLDLHISPTILGFSRRRIKEAVIDLKKPVDDYMDYEVMDPIKGSVIHPKEFFLGVTDEWFHLPDQLLANVEGKSSLGRLGLVVHATAGFIDPGFAGHVTLEITNLTEQPLIIYPHMPIGQVRFTVLTSPAENLYGSSKLKSKYVNEYSKNPKPMPSQFWKNFTK